MRSLRLILGDQLSHNVSALTGLVDGDIVLMAEVMDEAHYVRHHKKKIAFIFAAMRHFAEELKSRNIQVRYVRLEDEGNSHSLDGEVDRALTEQFFDQVIITEPGEYRLAVRFGELQRNCSVPVEIRPDDRFLISIGDFRRWAAGRKGLRMEYFYRHMRQRYNILMEPDGKPAGGEWNFDSENRKPMKGKVVVPRRLSHKKSAITQDVLELVSRRFADHFGDLEPFHFALTRDQALSELHQFIDEILANFGDHQDAMVHGEPFLFHSLLSTYLNSGLLQPLEICQLAETAYRNGKAPLNAVEGFIRQILGWREYVRGIYWLNMPGYAEQNFLDAKRPLPALYWNGKTGMACMADAIAQTRQNAYSHHIQRLMITGNFALLAGLEPKAVCEWYLLVYTDAFEWVELPNTLGMALFADGGMMASKPYAASGKYIDKMSNHCKSCAFDPSEMTGRTACPFNSLYWDFIERNQDKIGNNQRLAYVYANWTRMSSDRKFAIKAQAADVLARLDSGSL